MKLLLLYVAVALALAAIPATIIDAGTLIIDNQQSFRQYTVVLNVVFTVRPAFTALLSGFELTQRVTDGYSLDAYLNSPATAGIIQLRCNDTASFKFRWVASQGEHLQFFGNCRYLHNYQQTAAPKIFEVDFDYPNIVQWSPGTFEVAITAVIQRFTRATTSRKLEISIAKWGGTEYGYSGDGPFILSNDALYGPNCPFTTSQIGEKVVKMYGNLDPRTFIQFTLIFHKVQVTGTIKTGFAVVRTHSRDKTTGSYSDDISNPTYNPVINDPATVRIYGFESFSFNFQGSYNNIMEISTIDGVNTVGKHDTQPTANFAYSREFYASYLVPTPTCPPGCVCASGVVCSSCIPNTYRVANPVTIDGTAVCPCIKGFYQDADKVCEQCTPSAYCDTCELDASGTFVCTACKCSQHRELNNGQCVCKSGYTNASPIGPYCVKI